MGLCVFYDSILSEGGRFLHPITKRGGCAEGGKEQELRERRRVASHVGVSSQETANISVMFTNIYAV